jgi:HSP20 family protein
MAFENRLLPWKWGKKNVPIRREDALAEYSPFYSLQQDINRLFDSFFQGFENRSMSTFEETSSPMFSPSLDITETDSDVRVTIELPGLTDKEIDLSISENSLTVKGEKKEEREENTSGYYRMERLYGSFYRSIPLPCSIDRDKVQATFKQGVLSISMPKTRQALQETRKITINKE